MVVNPTVTRTDRTPWDSAAGTGSPWECGRRLGFRLRGSFGAPARRRSADPAETLTLTANDADPARAGLAADVIYRWREHAFETEIRARSLQTSDATAFDLGVELEVDLDGRPFFRRQWRESIPRRLV